MFVVLSNHVCLVKNYIFYFLSNDFNEFCEDHGIKRLLMVSRSPQQNDVVKAKNTSILNMAKSMLKTKKMPKKFWAEVVNYAIYLSNKCHTKNLNVMIP